MIADSLPTKMMAINKPKGQYMLEYKGITSVTGILTTTKANIINDKDSCDVTFVNDYGQADSFHI